LIESQVAGIALLRLGRHGPPADGRERPGPRLLLAGSVASQLLLGPREVQGEGSQPASPLESPGGLALVGGETVQAGAEVGPEPGFLRIVPLERPFDQSRGEELLGSWRRISGSASPAAATTERRVRGKRSPTRESMAGDYKANRDRKDFRDNRDEETPSRGILMCP